MESSLRHTNPWTLPGRWRGSAPQSSSAYSRANAAQFMPHGFSVTLESAVQPRLSAVTGLQLCPPFKGLQDSPHCGILALPGRGGVQLNSILLEAGRGGRALLQLSGEQSSLNHLARIFL